MAEELFRSACERRLGFGSTAGLGLMAGFGFTGGGGLLASSVETS